MKKSIPHLLVFVVVLTLSACSAMVHTETVRFHALPSTSDEKTYVVWELNEAQRDSLEFRTYAKSIGRRLESHGFVAASPGQKARYALSFNYGVSDGRTASQARYYEQQAQAWERAAASGYGQANLINSAFAGYFRGRANREQLNPTTAYTRTFKLLLTDLKTSTPDRLDNVFDATVISHGSNASFQVVAECLFDAALADFPGRDGETFRRIFNVDQCH